MFTDKTEKLTKVSNCLTADGITYLPKKIKEEISHFVFNTSASIDDIVKYVKSKFTPSENVSEYFRVNETLTFCDYPELTELGEIFCSIFNVEFIHTAYVSEDRQGTFNIYIECGDGDKISSHMEVSEFLYKLNQLMSTDDEDYLNVLHTLCGLDYRVPKYSFYLSIPLYAITTQKCPFAHPNQMKHLTMCEFETKLSQNAEFITYYNQNINKSYQMRLAEIS